MVMKTKLVSYFSSQSFCNKVVDRFFNNKWDVSVLFSFCHELFQRNSIDFSRTVVSLTYQKQWLYKQYLCSCWGSQLSFEDVASTHLLLRRDRSHTSPPCYLLKALVFWTSLQLRLQTLRDFERGIQCAKFSHNSPKRQQLVWKTAQWKLSSNLRSIIFLENLNLSIILEAFAKLCEKRRVSIQKLKRRNCLFSTNLSNCLRNIWSRWLL